MFMTSSSFTEALFSVSLISQLQRKKTTWRTIISFTVNHSYLQPSLSVEHTSATPPRCADVQAKMSKKFVVVADDSSASDLQDEIERREKELQQLYEKRSAQLTATQQKSMKAAAPDTSVQHPPWSGQKGHHRIHQLRIQCDPPPSPMSCMGTPESVALPLTGEARRIEGKSISMVVASVQSLLKPFAESTPAPLTVPPEFTERLRRLHCASKTQRTLTLPAARISLLCSPISCLNPEDDASCGDVFEEHASLLDGAERSVRVRGNESCTPRHVRFSSQSPRISTFSVERCGAEAEHQDTGLDTGGAASPFISSDLLSSVNGNAANANRSSCQGGVSIAADIKADACLAPPPHSLDSASMSPRASRISTMLSPRSSVSSYLALISDLRSSLHDSCPRTTPHTPARAYQPVCAETPLCASRSTHRSTEGDDVFDAATPTKTGENTGKVKEEGQAASSRSLLHATRSCTSPSITTKHTKAASETVRTDSDVVEALASVLSSPPVFLQRRNRQRESAATNAPTPQCGALTSHVRDRPTAVGEKEKHAICAELSPSSSPNPPARPRAKQIQSPQKAASPSVVIKKKKTKTVHFPESLGKHEHDVQPPPRPRRGKKTTARSASPPTSVSTVLPPDLCVEQHGLGAGILLACGPTLYFD